MTPLRFIGVIGALTLAACTAAVPIPDAGGASLAAAVVTAPPATAPGVCWHGEVLPAIYETVTVQAMVPAQGAGAASLRSETQQRMVRPRRDIWFRVVCPEAGADTPDFVATLQRALKARGVYGLPVTGVMDDDTRAAIRRWQAARGLDSAVLSLAGARLLGIVPAEFS